MALELVLSELSKVYRRRKRSDVHAVRGVDLEVGGGELVALLGPSGCGKSTTLRMIAGLEQATSGDIRVGDRSIVDLPAHERSIGVAFENYALYPPLTVRENLAFGMQARGEPEWQRKVEQISERIELDDILDVKPGRLSSGQKQRVSLARALARDPDVLLLDEPLSHLDAAQRDTTRRELRRLQRETGYTTVLVTHDQQEAISMADRIVVMNDGRFVQVGTPDEVYDQPASLFVAGFVGEPPMNLFELRSGDGPLGALADVPAGREIVLGVRPLDVEVLEGGTDGALAGRVHTYEALLEQGLATIDLTGAAERLLVQTPPEEPLEPGQEVRVRLPPDRLHVFDADSGERLN